MMQNKCYRECEFLVIVFVEDIRLPALVRDNEPLYARPANKKKY